MESRNINYGEFQGARETRESRGTLAHQGLAFVKRISWGAVIAGVLIALVTQLCLSLLGLGIGMGTIDPVEESNPLKGLGTGALIWWSVTMLISLFAGGWVAGRLAGVPTSFDSILHGVLTWSVATLISFYLVTTTVGSIIGGVGNVIGKTASAAGRSLGSLAPQLGQAAQNGNLDLSTIKQEARTLLKQTGKAELQPGALKEEAQEMKQEAREQAQNAGTNPQNTDEAADNLVDELFARGGNILEEVDQEAVANVIMKRTGKSREEANQIAQNWVQSFQKAKAQLGETAEEAKMKAQKAADDAASAASKAGIFGFFGLLIGAVAAGVGGKVGEPKDAVVVREEK